jgi:hypothetical protein
MAISERHGDGLAGGVDGGNVQSESAPTWASHQPFMTNHLHTLAAETREYQQRQMELRRQVQLITH